MVLLNIQKFDLGLLFQHLLKKVLNTYLLFGRYDQHNEQQQNQVSPELYAELVLMCLLVSVSGDKNTTPQL